MSGLLEQGILVPVYHETWQHHLSSIDERGLLPYLQLPPEVTPKKRVLRVEVDEIIDKEAKRFRPGFSRRNSIFAFPNLGRDWANVVLQIMVNPEKVLVSDMICFDEVAAWAFDLEDSLKDLRYARHWARKYWGESMTLTEYLKGGQGNFAMPEVIIPCPVEKEKVSILRTPLEIIDVDHKNLR